MLFLYFFLTVLCIIPHGASQKGSVSCGLASTWLESVVLSINIVKEGFHRELVFEIRHDHAPCDVQVLLVQGLPSGVYIDQYQLASLREDTGLQVLLDSAVDVEDPAYASSGFSAMVYLSSPGLLQAVVPFHGRYHRPSTSGGWEQVPISSPRLLLRPEHCKTVTPTPPHKVVEAPCTVHNESLCSWLEIEGLQVLGFVSLEFPVGDFTLAAPVCAGTALVTMLCCAFLLRTIWKHGTF
ncbi:phosphatidylinositol-glycan biosynthesis class X protein [Electrophorus electricus]|uniref:Phosphatidylinositol-glycan biosynthesis class X protein n=1 Tax=Electrophorus electricus TaxID=8005 RepID=A0A4W4HK60_ELEEL|nr:phosphatidylinositol-glycan biosynthesis class X protein [Electrophorus electricus]